MGLQTLHQLIHECMHFIMEIFRRPLVQRVFSSSAFYIKNHVFLLPDCLYGTFGVECRKTCNCKGGICDRETGACLTLPFFAKIASKLKNEPPAGKSANGRPLISFYTVSATFVSPGVYVFRRRGGIRRGPEHRSAHRPFQSSKAARPSLTSNPQTEWSVNVALTYKRSANLYFMILNCDKLF